MSLGKRSTAEMIGTFWLVFGGCGSAVLAAAFPELGIGFVGVSLAFGLTVLTMAFAIGHISGCHLNPAVSVGLVAGKRFPAKELPAYILAQLVGAILAAGVLYTIASGKAGFSLAGGFAANGFDARAIDGTGALRLVSPFSVDLTVSTSSYAGLPGFAQLDLVFTPEPGTIALLATGGLGMLPLLRRRRTT